MYNNGNNPVPGMNISEQSMNEAGKSTIASALIKIADQQETMKNYLHKLFKKIDAILRSVPETKEQCQPTRPASCMLDDAIRVLEDKNISIILEITAVLDRVEL